MIYKFYEFCNRKLLMCLSMTLLSFINNKHVMFCVETKTIVNYNDFYPHSQYIYIINYIYV